MKRTRASILCSLSSFGSLRSLSGLCILLLIPAATASAQLDTPVWYLSYDATIKTAHNADALDGTKGTVAWTVERGFSGATAVLDLRSEGAVLSATQMMSMDPDKMKNMSPEEAMKFSQQYMDAMQYTANWMPGPVEGVDGQDGMRRHMESVSVPVNIKYERFASGVAIDDDEKEFDYERKTTAKSLGHKIYLSDQFKFELNTSSKKYWLSLPYWGQDMSGTEGVEWVETGKSRPTGTPTWGAEEHTTRNSQLEHFLAEFKVEPGKDGMGGFLIEGTFSGTGPITGEKTFKGTLNDGAHTVPMTLTYRYTVSPTPPAKGK
jgi:hypothetical protein